MSFSVQTPLILTGLPGSGRHRVRRAVIDQLGVPADQVRIEPSKEPSAPACGQRWCVVDLRSPFDAERDRLAVDYLAQLLKQAQGVVLTFTEAAELESQTFWSRWIRKQQPDLPMVRLTYERFPQDWAGFASGMTVDSVEPPAIEQALQTFEYSVGRVSLDHLMMGLDNSRQTLGMALWRVQAVLDTYEYENRVALEATPFRWDTYAAEAGEEAGWIRIQGVELDSKWLEEVISAAKLGF